MNLTSMLPLAPSSFMMCLQAEQCLLVRCVNMASKTGPGVDDTSSACHLGSGLLTVPEFSRHATH
jgi:hypothetical protein